MTQELGLGCATQMRKSSAAPALLFVIWGLYRGNPSFHYPVTLYTGNHKEEEMLLVKSHNPAWE